MDFYSISAILVVLAALFGYMNVRFLKLPNTIGIMVITLVASFLSIWLSRYNDSLLRAEDNLLGQIDFNSLLLNNMLGFLLFAGAMHTDIREMKKYRWPIGVFATVGVIISMFLIGVAMFYVLDALGMHVPLAQCLLFGALISPTDPVAVLGILKQAGVPKALETKIVGESLFNDGIGVVLYITMTHIASNPGEGIEWAKVFNLFAREIFGGVILGLILGRIAFSMMKRINNFEVEVIITLATVMSGTLLANQLHVSGPLAMVVAGMFIGNDKHRAESMSESTALYVDKFWELMDILLNAVLFVLIGMEMVSLDFVKSYLWTGIFAIPIVLAARYLSLVLPVDFFEKRLEFVPKTTLIMTWGGLRGGISIALALGLPAVLHRDLFLVTAYIVVVFSILVQGLTMEPLVRKLRVKYNF